MSEAGSGEEIVGVVGVGGVTTVGKHSAADATVCVRERGIGTGIGMGTIERRRSVSRTVS
jgi:hypothetical protein